MAKTTATEGHYYIRCNGYRVHITPRSGELPAHLDGQWDGEQCEGCGEDIATVGRVLDHKGAVVCDACGERYVIRYTELEAGQ